VEGKCTICKTPVSECYELCPGCFALLKPVRVFSSCGPCLNYYRMVRENKTTFTVVFKNGSGYSLERYSKGLVHESPCLSCQNHPETQYPDGYMD